MYAAAAPASPKINMDHSWTTQAGHLVRIRPIDQHDVDRVTEYLDGLSVGTRYFRFGRRNTRHSRDEVIRICNPDPARCRRLIAVTEQHGKEIQIASAAFVVGSDKENGELSILVADQWQGTRVAHRLMSLLILSAREFGLKRIFAKVLGTNSRMIGFAHRHGFKLVPGTEGEQIKSLVLFLDESTGVAGQLPSVASGPS